MINNHGVNGWHLKESNNTIIASLDTGVFNQLIEENLRRQVAKKPSAVRVSVDKDELLEAVESRLRKICNIPDNARLTSVIHQSTMVFQTS